jgi:hypothetical protein
MDPHRLAADLVPTAYIDFLQSCIHLRSLTKRPPFYTWRIIMWYCVHLRLPCAEELYAGESGVPSAASFRPGIAHHLCRYYHAHHLLEMICVLQPARRDVESPGSGQPQLLFLHLYTFCWLCSSSGDRHPKHQWASHHACADLGEYVRWSRPSPRTGTAAESWT